MKRTTAFALSSVLVFLPIVLFAAPNDLGDLIEGATDLLNPIIGLLTGLAVIAFFWGIVQYIFYAGDEKKKLSGKNIMLHGVIALFVLFAFWGIVQFINQEIFG